MTRDIQICASMLCANQGNIKGDIEEINKSGVDYMHIDIMDGHFVPNMTGGSDLAKCIRQYSDAPCDIHLMVSDADNIIEDLDIHSGDRVSVHFEGNRKIESQLKRIRELGGKAGIAVCPGTPISAISPYFDMVDYFLMLIVNPGFKGQPIIERTLTKISQLKKIIIEQNRDIRLFIDGAVTCENIIRIVESGADDLVLGPFSCFNYDLGGICPTLKIIKNILSENGYRCNLNNRGGEQI